MINMALSVILGLAIGGEIGPLLGTDDAPVEHCAFSDMSQTLATEKNWHDLSYSVLGDPDFASELMRVMPDYRLAFAYRDHSGVLLVGGQKLDSAQPSSPQKGEYWVETAEDVRVACESEEVKCTVDVFDDAPYGLRASTRFETDTGAIRRETLAFMDKDQCVYSVQYSTHESEISEKGWQDVGQTLMTLRNLVGDSMQQTRR